ncbi:hypothetical protein TorRG33x02_005850 [Trema orientale]|uniref:Uncharacterized protein n=1 Tax=Trema orientale TaxID=63057 RepID=A0A2P5FZZ7_TREOI|nr:hypothetical protein TorRG33x02_005850 [Trema orientale]
MAVPTLATLSHNQKVAQALDMVTYLPAFYGSIQSASFQQPLKGPCLHEFYMYQHPISLSSPCKVGSEQTHKPLIASQHHNSIMLFSWSNSIISHWKRVFPTLMNHNSIATRKKN